jgi:hypothetical protein
VDDVTLASQIFLYAGSTNDTAREENIKKLKIR